MHFMCSIKAPHVTTGHHSSSSSFFFLLVSLLSYLFILFLTVLGLHCCSGFSLVVVSRAYSLVAVHGFPTAVASLVAEHGLQGARAGVAAVPRL